MIYEDARCCLKHDICDPPTTLLDLPASSNGESKEAISSHALFRMPPSLPFADSRSQLTRHPEKSSFGSGTVRHTSAELLKGEEANLDADLGAGSTPEESPGSQSPLCAPTPGDLETRIVGAPSSAFIVPPTTSLVDKDAESAIQALLALQREPSPTSTQSQGSSPEPYRRRPFSPSLGRQGGINKVGGTEASRFFCKFPRCGKAYASTDAVRKHCRQRHLDWLRRLGHGCPALYCRLEE